MQRCPWLDTSKSDYVAYHDHEWGVPLFDDRRIFEFLLLESAQAGLSWYTVLKKREAYRQAFADFRPDVIAAFTPSDVASLLQNPGIIRNRAKIEAAIANARCFIQLQRDEGSASDYFWRFVDYRPIVNHWRCLDDYPASTPLSERISTDLKKRGFRFVGPTIIYAHLQAMGIVNDHSINCFRRQQLIDTYDTQLP